MSRAPADSVSTQELLLATYHINKIALYEIGVGECPAYPELATGRLQCVYASLLATKKVFDVYSSIPAERLSGICFTLWAQFNHALLNGVKLLASEADGWDLQHARSLLMFPDILHSQVKAMKEIISRRRLVSEPLSMGRMFLPESYQKYIMHYGGTSLHAFRGPSLKDSVTSLRTLIEP